MGTTDVRMHRAGVLLVATAALIWSTAGFFTRLISVDTWTLLFWRSLFGALFLLGVLVRQEGRGALRAIRSMGWPGWGVAILSTLVIVTYFSALRLTAVADVMVIQATLPFVVAGLAWAVMRERASRATLMASGLAIVGVLVMLGGAPLTGNPWGDVLAFATTVIYAGIIVMLRWHRNAAMTSAALVSVLLGAAVSWPFAAPAEVGARDLLCLIVFGVTQSGVAFLLLTIGSRLIPATENALIGTIETPLGPAWVWLAFGEVPTAAAVLGGTVVLIAVIGHLIAESRL